MAQVILVVGPSGSGKTTGARNLDPKTTTLIVPEKKEPPFKGWKKNYVRQFTAKNEPSSKGNLIYEADINKINQHLINIGTRVLNVKTVLIDTVTYALLESVMRESKNADWGKYIKFAEELKTLIETAKGLRDDLTVIITSHDETTESDGFSAQTKNFKVPAGKFTKEKIVPEGLFTIVLWSLIKGEGNSRQYLFQTQSDGIMPAKSPDGMFSDMHIPNDYKYVIDCVNAYNNDEEPPAPIQGTEQKAEDKF